MDLPVDIREAGPEDWERLSELAMSSKAFWKYPKELMERWVDELTLTPEYIESNPTYFALLEDEDEKFLHIGFYSLSFKEGICWLDHLWVLPEHIGAGFGGQLFLHACEIAETLGATELHILSDPNAEGFYLRMGAQRAGEEPSGVDEMRRMLPHLVMFL